MPTVAPAQANGAIGVMVDNTDGMSIESLIMITSTRLNDVDLDVRRRLTGQQSRSAVQGKLSAAIAELKLQGKGFKDATKMNSVNLALKEAHDTARVNGDMAACAALEKISADLNWNGEGVAKSVINDSSVTNKDNEVNEQQLTGSISTIEGLLTNNTKSSELEMIDIQQLMSKRAQMLQFATNMINSMNEPVKSAIGNIR
jgi:hypothetical protein